MALEFVNRRYLVDRLTTLIQIAPRDQRLVLLDSPAGMGKTKLLTQVCLELMQQANGHGEQVAWKIVRLDFREALPRRYDRRDILTEIARQICSEPDWDSILRLAKRAKPEDLLLIRQAVAIPMRDQDRQALLRVIGDISDDDFDKIKGLIVQALQDVNIQNLEQNPQFTDPDIQVGVLVGFVRRMRNQYGEGRIPKNVLLVLDGLDAVPDEALRMWVIGDLALRLHDSLQRPPFERFFVVVSGRYIEDGLEPRVRRRFVADNVLHPFTADIVADLIRQFDDEQFNSDHVRVTRLSRRLYQVCGGHPRVLKETARQLNTLPGRFMSLVTDPAKVGHWYDDPIVRGYVKEHRDEAIKDIMEGVSPRQRLLLRLLSVFRKFNSATLEVLRSKIANYPQPSEDLDRLGKALEGNLDRAFDGLLQTRLIWDGGIDQFSSDRIILSLMAAQLRDERLEFFCQLNKWAAEVFEDWFHGRFPDDPSMPRPIVGAYQQTCLIEALFHRLCRSKPCCDIAESLTVGEHLLNYLDGLLDDLQPCPAKCRSRQLRLQLRAIRNQFEKDVDIDNRIWEVAFEDARGYGVIREHILGVFKRWEKVFSVVEWLFNWLDDALAAAQKEGTVVDDRQLVRELSEELDEIRRSGDDEMLRRIRREVERDDQIDGMIKSAAQGDSERYRTIRDRILTTIYVEQEKAP